MKTNLIIVLFSFICLFSLPAAGSAENNPGAVPGYTGIVQFLEGQVTMDGQTLEIGDRVKSGATFITGADSYCEIIFGGKNIFRIMENTLAVITLEKGKGDLNIKKGAMAFLLTKLDVLSTNDPEFGVRTPSAALGIRGTAFFVKTESETSTYICACNGVLQVEDPKGGQSQPLTGVHHKAVRFEKSPDGNFSVTPAGLLYHNDEDMNNLAKGINAVIPWDSTYSGGTY